MLAVYRIEWVKYRLNFVQVRHRHDIKLHPSAKSIKVNVCLQFN